MHLTPEGTALSPAAITGNKELSMNAMLLCNNCVEQNERDNFIRCRTLAKLLKNSIAWMLGKTEEYGKATNGLSG